MRQPITNRTQPRVLAVRSHSGKPPVHLEVVSEVHGGAALVIRRHVHRTGRCAHPWRASMNHPSGSPPRRHSMCPPQRDLGLWNERTASVPAHRMVSVRALVHRRRRDETAASFDGPTSTFAFRFPQAAQSGVSFVMVLTCGPGSLTAHEGAQLNCLRPGSERRCQQLCRMLVTTAGVARSASARAPRQMRQAEFFDEFKPVCRDGSMKNVVSCALTPSVGVSRPERRHPVWHIETSRDVRLAALCC